MYLLLYTWLFTFNGTYGDHLSFLYVFSSDGFGIRDGRPIFCEVVFLFIYM